jgi:hypothetical protein
MIDDTCLLIDKLVVSAISAQLFFSLLSRRNARSAAMWFAARPIYKSNPVLLPDHIDHPGRKSPMAQRTRLPTGSRRCSASRGGYETNASRRRITDRTDYYFAQVFRGSSNKPSIANNLSTIITTL